MRGKKRGKKEGGKKKEKKTKRERKSKKTRSPSRYGKNVHAQETATTNDDKTANRDFESLPRSLYSLPPPPPLSPTPCFFLFL